MHGYYPIRLVNIPGHIRGFDIRTGKQLWNFNLVPQPGEFGAETWKNGSKVGTPGVGKVDAWPTYSSMTLPPGTGTIATAAFVFTTGSNVARCGSIAAFKSAARSGSAKTDHVVPK